MNASSFIATQFVQITLTGSAPEIINRSHKKISKKVTEIYVKYCINIFNTWFQGGFDKRNK